MPRDRSYRRWRYRAARGSRQSGEARHPGPDREPQREPPAADRASRRCTEPAIPLLSPLEIAYCCVVLVACYALRGSTGFGAAAAMPLLGIVIPMKVLAPAWTLVGLVASVTLFGQDRHHVAWREMAKLAPACLVGVLAGPYLFTVLDSAALARRVGILVLPYWVPSRWATLRPR